MNGAGRRIAALMLRHWYLIRSSWPRLVELTYWPTVHLIMWGFLQNFLSAQAGPLAAFAATLVGAVFLWEVLFRCQINFSISFLEEMWSRNLGGLLVSPLRAGELVAGLMAMSLTRAAIGLIPTAFVASLAFDFSWAEVWPGVIGFVLNLTVFGWTLALIGAGVVLRNGLGSETLIWASLFLFLPFCCVYYPLASLPEPLQAVAVFLPPTFVFESLRATLAGEGADVFGLLRAGALNAVYLAGALAFFFFFLRSARRRGSLMRIGE